MERFPHSFSSYTPCHKTSFCLWVNWLYGVKTGKFSYFSALLTNSFFHSDIFSPFQQTTAPSYTDSSGSGITKLSSIPIIFPYPSHSGHAPTGELNENNWSVGSSNSIPSASNFKENSCSLLSSKRKMHFPSPSYNAVFAESTNLLMVAFSSATFRRSITNFMSCGVCCLSVVVEEISVNTSVILFTSPFTSTRWNPVL